MLFFRAIVALSVLLAGDNLPTGAVSADRADGDARYQSAHFILLMPRGVDPARLLDALELAYGDVRRSGLALPRMVGARSYASTDEFTRASGGASFNLAVAVGEKIHLQPPLLLLRRADAAAAYRHELTHVALAGAARCGLPRWLNEGIAMVVAGEKHPEQVRFSGVGPLSDSLADSRSHRTLRSAYAAAERLASRLITLYGRQAVFAMLRSVGSDGEFERSFRGLTGLSSTEWGNRELRK